MNSLTLIKELSQPVLDYDRLIIRMHLTKLESSVTTLHTIEELKTFINNRSIPLIPKRERIRVQLDSLDGKANNKLEAELNQLHVACGCAEGSIASVIGLALFVLYLTFIDIDATFSGMEALFYALGTFFTFMFVGKFGTILKAHLKLKKLPQRYL